MSGSGVGLGLRVSVRVPELNWRIVSSPCRDQKLQLISKSNYNYFSSQTDFSVFLPNQTGRWRFFGGWAASCGWRKAQAVPAGWSRRWQLRNPPLPPAAGTPPPLVFWPRPGWLGLNLGGLHGNERVNDPIIRKLWVEYCNIWSQQGCVGVSAALATNQPSVFLCKDWRYLRKWEASTLTCV